MSIMGISATGKFPGFAMATSEDCAPGALGGRTRGGRHAYEERRVSLRLITCLRGNLATMQQQSKTPVLVLSHEHGKGEI